MYKMKLNELIYCFYRDKSIFVLVILKLRTALL